MDNEQSDSKKRTRKILFNVLKATVKATIFYVIYFFVSSIIIAPVSQLIPGIQQMIEAFVIVYFVLMIIGDLTSGTIFQHFFNAAKALFVMAYLILSLNGGLFGMTVENINLMVDLRLFVVIAMLLSLVGLAKSVLQAINYMSQKAEPLLI